MTFGALLRRHRSHRGLSQERLALEAEISTRHLSCLETNKSAPSRSMVLVLGSALDITLRDRNALLEAAGFTAAYRDEPLDAPEAAALRQAVDMVLTAVEPNGAVAVDHAWCILQMNAGAARLLTQFADLSQLPAEIASNLVAMILHPLGLRPAIVNFEEVAAFTLERSRREIHRRPDDPRARSMLALLESMPDLPSHKLASTASAGPFLRVHLRRDGVEARLFSTIASIGTPIDATAEEIAIETFFPADEATRRLVHGLAQA